jgi:hypothetical protein
MALKGFRNPQQNDGPTQALAKAVADFTRQLENNPLLGGRRLEGVTVGTSTTNIPHLLGQAWKGWFVTRNSNGASVEQGTQVDDTQYLSLFASASVVVDIYVF